MRIYPGYKKGSGYADENFTTPIIPPEMQRQVMIIVIVLFILLIVALLLCCFVAYQKKLFTKISQRVKARIKKRHSNETKASGNKIIRQSSYDPFLTESVV